MCGDVSVLEIEMEQLSRFHTLLPSICLPLSHQERQNQWVE